MAAASAPGDPTQALETRKHDVPGPAALGRTSPRGAAGGGKLARLVAEQRWRHQTGADRGLLRPPRHTPSLMTSTARTARCGPACRVVWEGCAHVIAPYPDRPWPRGRF